MFRVAYKNSKCHFEAWPMKFDTQEEATTWINLSYPRDMYSDIEWIIFEELEGWDYAA